MTGFFGQNRELGVKSEFRPRWESEVGIPTLVGERSWNSGSDARQVVRPGGGFYAGQVARQGEAECSAKKRALQRRVLCKEACSAKKCALQRSASVLLSSL